MWSEKDEGPDQKLQFKWFFNPYEVELWWFYCEILIGSSERTSEFIRSGWFFELQDFESYETYNLINNHYSFTTEFYLDGVSSF